MAGTRYLGAVGPSYNLGARKVAAQRSVNWYVKAVEAGGENQSAFLESAPGFALFADLGATIRAVYATDTRLFAVAGSTLYEVSAAGVTTAHGTIGSTSGFVGMTHGRNQLVLADGALGYVLDLVSSTFTQISSSGWRGSHWAEELDGYFVFTAPDTDQFYLSAIDNALTFNALDFSSADSGPDNIVTHRTLRHELLLFGTRSTEVWVDSGDPAFPLVRFNSTPIDVGCVGVRSVARTTDSVVWVGQTAKGAKFVYTLEGHQPRRISTLAVEEALATSTDISQCSTWSYSSRGSEFVAVNAPGMSTTWVYDTSSHEWHERGELVSGEWTPLRADFVVFFNAGHYAAIGSKLYEVRTDAYDIEGTPLTRERTFPHLVAPSTEPVTYSSLELGCTTGNGGVITLEISNDGGFVFGPPLLRSLGATGQRMQRVRWLGLGAAKDRVFRIRCTEAVPLVLQSCNIDAGA